MTSTSSCGTAQKLSWTDDDLMEEEEKFNSEWDDVDVDDVDDVDDGGNDVAELDSQDHQVLHETIKVIDEASNHDQVPTAIRSTTIIKSSTSPPNFSETPTPPFLSSRRPPLSDGKLMKFVVSSNSTYNVGGGGSSGSGDVAIMTTATPRVLLTSMNKDGNESTPLSLSSPSSNIWEEGDFEEVMRERNRVSKGLYEKHGWWSRML
jgi:hypothetical protein